MTTFCIGDIHGNYIGLVDVLNRSKFDFDNDILISLGDFCDGGQQTQSVINTLLGVRNLINIAGNHDLWALQWMRNGEEYPTWWHQGGMATAKSYGFNPRHVPKSHVDFIAYAIPYYIDEQNRVFVHGGFNPSEPIENQSTDILTWDRTLLCEYAPKHEIKGYKHVYVGHTSTQMFDKIVEPVTFHNLTDLDTGGGWNGRLTIMDIDTGKYWQSHISANMQNEMIENIISQTEVWA